MTTLEWIESNIDYGRSLIRSGLEGAVAHAPVTSALIDSVRDSWMPAVIGAYVGALGASIGNRRKPHYGGSKPARRGDWPQFGNGVGYPAPGGRHGAGREKKYRRYTGFAMAGEKSD
jgi:hypothetical protein